MAEFMPRATLFVPGTPTSVEAWNASLRQQGLRIDDGWLRGKDLDAQVAVQWVENDGEFGQAFSFGTVEPEGVTIIDQAPGALVLDWSVDLRDGRLEMLKLARRLRSAGALAVRIEQSKVGWGIDEWLELLGSEDSWAWYRLSVAMLGDEETVQTCGMRAFCLPDVWCRREGDETALTHFCSVLNVYQIAEDPLLLSGQTFSPDSKTPRRVVERWPDLGYPPDHPCHNPYGVWRLGAPGGAARPLTDPEPVFTPPLRVILRALEAEQGAPLTRKQVEAARDNSICITMEHRRAQKLERARGYADINPEFVWEQWQLLR